jgi:fructose-1,6-bisphosphatase/inositol monophosphatase family enzyme
MEDNADDQDTREDSFELWFFDNRSKKKRNGYDHFSTNADRESLQHGLTIMRRFFPSEEIIAEEKENTPKIPQNCTVFDPLDGSTNFFNGLDEFGITICTLRDGHPWCGATYFPVRKQLISAVRGKGCYINGFKKGTKIESVRWHEQVDKAIIGADVGPWTHQCGTFDTVLKPLSQRFNVLSAMSAVEGCRRVLFGQTIAYYNVGIAKIWDAAAMILAIEETGGVAFTPDGSALQWNNLNCDWVTAINPELAELVLKHTRKWRNRRE